MFPMPDPGGKGSTTRGAVYAVRRISMALFINGKIGAAHIIPQCTKWKDGDAGNFVRMINWVVLMRVLLIALFRPIGIVAVAVIYLILIDRWRASLILTDCQEIFGDIGMGQRPEKCRNHKGRKKQDSEAMPIFHPEKHSAV